MKQIFIQVIGCCNRSVFESGFIQHLTCFFRQVSQVTAVQTDAVAGQLHTCVTHFLKYADCVRHTGFQSVIRINEQSAVIRIEISVSLKCSIFIREAHDPAVCVGSEYRYIKKLTCKYIGSTYTSADHSCSCTVKTCIRSLGTAQPKFHNSIAGCCKYNA